MYTHLCPDGVVDCLWLNGALKCFVRSGFVYDYQVSTNITVQIPRVFENQTGDYTCQVFGSDAGDIEKCTFTLKHDSKFTPCYCASYTCTHTLNVDVLSHWCLLHTIYTFKKFSFFHLKMT